MKKANTTLANLCYLWYNYTEEVGILMKVFLKNECELKEGMNCKLSRCKCENNCPEPPHTHEFIEMVYILEGEGTQFINASEYHVSRGDLLFINYKQVHSFTTPKKMTYINILLDPEFISCSLINSENAFELLSLSAFSDFSEKCDQNTSLVKFSGMERDFIESLILELEDECKSFGAGCETIIRSGLTLLLTYVFRKFSENASEEKNGEPITNAITQYINEHLSEDISLEALARQSFYNPSYFSRMFKEKYGITLTAYIRKTRLERACTMLLEEKLPISKIAELSGFGSTTTFYKKFKAAYGLSPAEWKNSRIKR